MANNIKIKICGITNYRDAADAIDCGADAVGFVMAPSPRRITPDMARSIISRLPPFAIKVGVFVNAPLKQVKSLMNYCGFNIVQLHGDEDRKYFNALCPYALKVFRVDSPLVIKSIQRYGVQNFILDSRYGGSGQLIDVRIARQAARLGNMILAGGLTPDNVAQIIMAVRPYGVDVSSGVEKKPGKKNNDKMKAFIKAVTCPNDHSVGRGG
ncbi:MAG: phosphoribosylanthranilate isomerase [Planctomycetota bacterium]